MSNEDLLSRILSRDSFDRLNRIKILNKNEGEKLEDLLMKKFNLTRRAMTDDEFIQVLNENEKQKEKIEIVYKRRNKKDDLEDI